MPTHTHTAHSLLKAARTPRSNPLAPVRTSTRHQKSRFFVELRQENDPALAQVALEETDDRIIVQSAPVEALVLLLAHAWGFDETFEAQFIVTMRAFVQPLELLGMLRERYDAHMPPAGAPADKRAG